MAFVGDIKIKNATPKIIAKAKKNLGLYKTASISVSRSVYYNPLYTPTSLQLPRDRKQVNAWCRHFYETEAIPAIAVDLLSQLSINDYYIECAVPYIKDFFEKMCEHIDILNVLSDIAFEYWKMGDVFPMGELNTELGTWERFVILNPDFVDVKRNVLAGEPQIELIPDDDLKRIVFTKEPPEVYEYFLNMAPDVITYVKRNVNIPLNTTNVSHIRHKPAPYGVWGTPLYKRIFKSLMYREMIRRAQFTIAERYITPLKIFKLGTVDEPPTQEEIDDMEEKLAAVMSDPNLVFVTHSRLTADFQGIAGKSLRLTDEMDWLEREMLAGLGVSRALIHGEGPSFSTASWGGVAFMGRIEAFRRKMEKWIRNKVFKPICEIQQFIEKDKDTGRAKLIIPKFKFRPLKLVNDAENKRQLMALNKEKKISDHTLLEAYNLEYNTEDEYLLRESKKPLGAEKRDTKIIVNPEINNIEKNDKNIEDNFVDKVQPEVPMQAVDVKSLIGG